MKLFITDDELSLYHNFMILEDMIGSYSLGFRLVAQLKSSKWFHTLAFVDSIEELSVWADLNNIKIDSKDVE